MCIDDPARVIAVDAAGAIVDAGGRRRRASTLLVPDIGVGDWVTVAAGVVVDRLSPREAMEIQEILARGRSAATARRSPP